MAACLASTLWLLAGWINPAHAEKADRQKPTQVEADRMTYDDLRQVSIFTGHVVMTKGTLVLKADRLELSQDPQGYTSGLATGKPATFRQKRDGVDEYIEASGENLRYDGKDEVLRIEKNAQVRRLAQEKLMDEARGSVIVYDARTENYQVESGSGAATPNNPAGRVRLIIAPRQDPAATPAPATPGPALRNDTRIQAPR